MKITRAILTGVIIWILIFISFTLMSFIPNLKDELTLQNSIIYILLIPITYIGVRFYCKKEQTTSGLKIGLITIITSLILDALITVPLVIIPNGGSYTSFYSDPFLIFMVTEILILFFLFWKFKFQKNSLI